MLRSGRTAMSNLMEIVGKIPLVRSWRGRRSSVLGMTPAWGGHTGWTDRSGRAPAHRQSGGRHSARHRTAGAIFVMCLGRGIINPLALEGIAEFQWRSGRCRILNRVVGVRVVVHGWNRR